MYNIAQWTRGKNSQREVSSAFPSSLVYVRHTFGRVRGSGSKQVSTRSSYAEPTYISTDWKLDPAQIASTLPSTTINYCPITR